MYGNMTISKDAIAFMEKISRKGENCAYTLPDYPDIVFMSAYRKENGSFVVVDRDRYEMIRRYGWTTSNGYLRRSNSKMTYLQCMLIPKEDEEDVIHHKGHRFVYLCSMLDEMSKKDHPQEKTYIHGDFELTSTNIVWFRKILGGMVLTR